MITRRLPLIQQDDVQNDIIVDGVTVMLMGLPVSGPPMDFNATAGQTLAASDYGIPEVSALVIISPTRVDNLDSLPFFRGISDSRTESRRCQMVTMLRSGISWRIYFSGTR